MADKYGKIYILRHGETAWALSGQHTGLTDIPLTQNGRLQGVHAGARIHQVHPGAFKKVLASPAERAQDTARLAGYADYKVIDNMHEWDYGRAEGHSTKHIQGVTGSKWNLFRDGVQDLPYSLGNGWRTETLPDGGKIEVHPTDGETLGEVYMRALTVLKDEVMPVVNDGNDVLLVAHSHFLRILTAAFLSEESRVAADFELGTAEFSILSIRPDGKHVVSKWGL